MCAFTSEAEHSSTSRPSTVGHDVLHSGVRGGTPRREGRLWRLATLVTLTFILIERVSAGSVPTSILR